jgi:outer membrane usher protein
MPCVRSVFLRCFTCLMVLCAGSTVAFALQNAARDLVLEIWVNGANTNVVTTVADRDGQLWAARDDLLDAGINLNQMQSSDGKSIALAKLTGVAVAIDQPDQRLLIQARVDSLAPHVIDLRRTRPAIDTATSTGLLASYEVAATSVDFRHALDTSGVQGALAASLFGAWGTVKSTVVSEVDSLVSRAVRLDTTAEWDEPDIARRWLLGDAISGGLSWSRPVRFGGIQVARDFSLQPGFLTAPLPAFFGQAAVPSSVDVFVNSAHIFEGDVEPGPFEIRDLPVLTGGGEATVVVRNILGQQTTQTVSFYTTDALLEEGLSDYDFDLGFLRQAYGEKSFAYGKPLAAATYRYGLLNWVTVEGHTEIAPAAQVAGGQGAVIIGSFAAAGAGAAVSNSASGQGALFSAFFQSQSQPLSVFGSISATTGRYADVASTEDAPLPRLRTELGAELSFGRSGSLGASWIETKDDDSAAVRLLSASYKLSFAQNWYLGVTGLRDFSNRLWSAQLTLSVAVGQNASASISAAVDPHSLGVESLFAEPANPDGGWGYNVSASTGELGGAGGEATWIGDRGMINGAVSSVNGQTAARVSMSGGVVSMNGATFLTRVPDGAVALVETGKPDVPVYLENRQVAKSDSGGEALVTGLAADSANRISIDPTDYSFATAMSKTEQIVTPRGQTGLLVNLAPVRSRPALVTLEREDGAPPPVGSEVLLSSGGAPLVVGHAGQVFIEDLEVRTSGTVSWPTGSCRFSVTPPDAFTDDSIPALPPVRCAPPAESGR